MKDKIELDREIKKEFLNKINNEEYYTSFLSKDEIQ